MRVGYKPLPTEQEHLKASHLLLEIGNFFGYTAVLDDEANSSSGKLVNGVRQWEWDITSSSNQDYDIGASHWIHFVPGTAEDNGIWYRGTTVVSRRGQFIIPLLNIFFRSSSFQFFRVLSSAFEFV